MSVNDIYKLTIEGLGPSAQQLTNTLYYKQTAGTADLPGTALIDAWYAQCMAAFLDLLHEDVAVTKMHTRNLSSPEYGLDYDLSPTQAGTVEGLGLPPQCSANIQFTTGYIGKTNRGRNYLWPTAVDMQNHGQWNETYQGAAAIYMAALEDIDGDPNFWSLCILEGTGVGDPPVGVYVTEVTLDAIVRTQRRRVVGFGS